MFLAKIGSLNFILCLLISIYIALHERTQKTEKRVAIVRISGCKVSCSQGRCLRDSSPDKTTVRGKSRCEDQNEEKCSTSQCFAAIPPTEKCLASNLL